MIDESKARAWVDAYERAWRTAGTEQITGLFTSDATYRMHPFLEPHRGLEAIRILWDAERASHDEEFEMQSSVVAIERSRAVVRIEVRYGPPKPRHFRDLWILDFAPDGKCQAFEEWPMSPERIALDTGSSRSA